MTDLEGRVAFVTGVARGQGRSHAIMLAEAGADIIGLDICSDVETTPYPMATEEDLQHTAREIEKRGRSALLHRADTRELGEVEKVLADGVAQLGRLDIVVANAGIFSMGLAVDLSEGAWLEVIDTNLTGTWHTAKAAVPHIRKGGRGGSMIFTASAAEMLPPPGLAHYDAAKAGVMSLMETMALELAPEWIRVNTVNPTNVDTAMIDNDTVRRAFMPDKESPTKADAWEPRSAYIRTNALPIPWVEAVDVSEAVLFLASDKARYHRCVAAHRRGLPAQEGLTNPRGATADSCSTPQLSGKGRGRSGMASTRDWFETVAEAHRRAKRQLPKSVYLALVAGAEEGITSDDNIEAFAELRFRPRIGNPPPPADLATTVLGMNLSMPVLCSPTGSRPLTPRGSWPWPAPPPPPAPPRACRPSPPGRWRRSARSPTTSCSSPTGSATVTTCSLAPSAGGHAARRHSS